MSQMDSSFCPLFVLMLTLSSSFGCEYGSPVVFNSNTSLSAQPKIVPFEFPSQANVGDKVRVMCSVSGASPVRINWLKDGAPLPDSLARVLTEDDFSTIAFKSLSPAQAGNYTCLAENSFGSDRFTARLSIICESRPRAENSVMLTMPKFSSSVVDSQTSGCESGGWG